jgi:hypothetical protein
VTEDLQLLAERAGWTVENGVATYAPTEGGWVPKVRAVKMAGHSYERLHVAIVDPHGKARFTNFASLIGEAVRVAEGVVRGKNG